MGVAIEQVPMWALDWYQIGHACRRTDGHWAYTLCGSMMTSEATPERPKRICRKCRAQLKDAKLITEAETVAQATPNS